MYRKERRIPTLLALFLLFSGLGITAYIDQSSQSLLTSAGSAGVPSHVHITNISDRSFTVSWVTDIPSIGAVTITKDGKQSTQLDDLDTDAIVRPRLTHAVTVHDLVPNTSYPITIVSGKRCAKNACPVVTQKTAEKSGTPSSMPPLRGTVQTANGSPAEGALVYVTVGQSLPLSSRTDSAGLWVIPMTNLRKQDLSELVELPDNDILQISIRRASQETTTAIMDVRSLRNNVSLPPLIFGNSYNLTDLLSKRKGIIAQQEQNKTLGATTNRTGAAQSGEIEMGALGILFPKKDNDTTSDFRPRFRGVGVPDTSLRISLDGDAQAGTLKIGRDGTWNSRPTRELTPGTHRVTIQGVDRNNKPVSLSRQFIVLKSGERVLGESTPSGSITPTTTPTLGPSPTTGETTPTPTEAVGTVTVTPTEAATVSATPTFTPSPTSSPSATPTIQPPTAVPTTPPVGEPAAPGSATYTFLFAGAGIGLLALAAALFVFP